MMENNRIRFSNWEKFQGQGKRYESTSWIRLQNNIWMHELWDQLSDSEFRTFIFLLTYTSQKGHKTGEVVLFIDSLCRMSGLSKKLIIATVKKLSESLGIVEFVDEENALPSHSDVTVQSPLVNSATYVTNETNDKESIYSFFDELWRKNQGNLNAQTIKDWSPRRKRAAQARWKEHPEISYWERVISKASESPFCRGEIAPSDGNRHFKANIDWFLRPDTCVKLDEGFYSSTSGLENVILDF